MPRERWYDFWLVWNLVYRVLRGPIVNHSRWMLWCAGMFLLSVYLPGCLGRSEVDVVPRPVTLVDESAARHFGETLETRITSGDYSAAKALVDWDELVIRSTAGLGAPAEFREGMALGARDGQRANSALFAQIADVVRKGGSYEFLRVRVVNGERRALLRLLDEDGALNYHDYVLDKTAEGAVKAIDIYVMQSAELMSVTLRRMSIPLVAALNPSLSSRLSGAESDMIKSMDQFTRFAPAVRSNPQEALRIYQQFPESIRREKSILLLRLLAAQKTGDQAYSEAMDDFVKYHPHDPAVSFVTLDREFGRKNYEGVDKALDQLEHAVGGDPYLNVVRAGILISQEMYHEANEPLDAGLLIDPTLKPLHVAKVNIAIIVSDFELAAKHCAILRDLQAPIPDLETSPDYADFRRSESYRLYRNAGLE